MGELVATDSPAFMESHFLMRLTIRDEPPGRTSRVADGVDHGFGANHWQRSSGCVQAA